MLHTVQADPNVRDVVAGLVQARDAQIARVVAMVDDMPDRGAADALIAPLRGRLAQLRPTRPFGFTRLLFTPLDPVIIPGGRWRRGDVGVPRPALAPLGLAVQAALPDLVQALEAGAGRVAPDDRAAITLLGAGLWPQAAAALERMELPPDWAEASGLAAADFAELALTIAAVLRQASPIEHLAASRSIPDDGAIRDLLCRAEPRGGLALATMVSVLLARLPVPARVLALASDIAASARPPATDRAMDHTLAGLQAAMADGAADNGDATEAAVEAIRVALLLEGLEEAAPASPEQRRRLDQIRREADALCRKRFDRVVANTLAQANAVGVDHDDEAVSSLESTARDLRRLESAGRRLGGSEHYDGLVQAVCTRFRDHANGLGLADRVRVMEILAGPDQALALLQSEG